MRQGGEALVDCQEDAALAPELDQLLAAPGGPTRPSLALAEYMRTGLAFPARSLQEVVDELCQRGVKVSKPSVSVVCNAYLEDVRLRLSH